MHAELERVRQMLTKNGFWDGLIENVISKVLDKHLTQNQEVNKNKKKQ